MAAALALWSVLGDAQTSFGFGWRQFVASGQRLTLIGGAIGALFATIVVRHGRSDRLALQGVMSGMVFGLVAGAIKWGGALWQYRLPLLATLLLVGGAGWLMGRVLQHICGVSNASGSRAAATWRAERNRRGDALA